MKQLEERIKDRLEGYESSLPEGDLAEFRALLDTASAAPERHKVPPIIWLAPMAVAAGLALLFVSGLGPQQDVIQVIDNGPKVADVIEPASLEVEEEEPFNLPEVMVAGMSPVSSVQVNTAKTENDSAEFVSIVEERKPEPAGDEPAVSENHFDSITESGYTSPFAPAGNAGVRKPVSVNVGRAAARVLGGTCAVALAGVLPVLMKMGHTYDFVPSVDTDVLDPYGSDPEPPVDSRTSYDDHHMPLRAGLSLRIPFNERWSITSGIDYSWYSSSIEYSLSGAHKQNVHYLGIPIRADFTIARNRWVDVYVGAGAAVDFCVAAYEAGKKIDRDEIGISLIGAGGIQFNIDKNFGLFIDPALSWDMTSGNRVLDTFRSEHPLMLSVSSGLRLTIPSKK